MGRLEIKDANIAFHEWFNIAKENEKKVKIIESANITRINISNFNTSFCFLIVFLEKSGILLTYII